MDMEKWLKELHSTIMNIVSYGGDSFYTEGVYSDVTDLINDIRKHLDPDTFEKDQGDKEEA